MKPLGHNEHRNKFEGKVEYLSNKNGSVEVIFCTTCGFVVGTVCEHKKSTWTGPENDQKLICDLCGADGT